MVGQVTLDRLTAEPISTLALPALCAYAHVIRTVEAAAADIFRP
jgi:hypothetical protein